MTKIIFAPAVEADFERIFEHLSLYAPETASLRITEIISAIDILQSSPLIGRLVSNVLRELVISRISNGYLALYRYDSTKNIVRVLSIRSQREQGYKLPVTSKTLH